MLNLERIDQQNRINRQYHVELQISHAPMEQVVRDCRLFDHSTQIWAVDFVHIICKLMDNEYDELVEYLKDLVEQHPLSDVSLRSFREYEDILIRMEKKQWNPD